MKAPKHEGNEKLSQQKLQEKLDKIILPLVDKAVYLVVEMANKPKESQTYKDELYGLFAVAVEQGCKLSELVDERLDNELVKQAKFQQFEDTILNKTRNKNKEVVAKLNLMDRSGKHNRYVLPEDLDEKGNLKKK